MLHAHKEARDRNTVKVLHKISTALIDSAAQFTCDETDELVALYNSYGLHLEADYILQAHVDVDDHDDRHNTEDNR